MVNIQDLLDNAKCYQTIREMRWPDGVTCPHCSSDSVIKNQYRSTAHHDSIPKSLVRLRIIAMLGRMALSQEQTQASEGLE